MLVNARRGTTRMVLVLISALVLWGCSSSGRTYTKTQMQETLEIEILANTSKMFVYRLKWPDEAVPNHIRIARNGADTRSPLEQSGIDINRRTHDRLLTNATYVVEKMGYCSSGFFELDHSLSRYHLWLKGECKESATDADKKRFGTKKTIAINEDI